MSTRTRTRGRGRRDNQKAARALAEWARHGFSRATEGQIADTYKVAARTLWRWKDALDTDAELSALFRDRLNDYINGHWADDLDATIRASITRMLELIETCDDLTKVTEAFTALSEVALTREVLSGTANEDAFTPAGAAAEGRSDSPRTFN